MKPIFYALFAATVLAVMWSPVRGANQKSDNDEIVVAVIDFENVSGQTLPEIGRVAHDVLNSYLVGLPSVSVVTRDKLGSVLKEQELGTSGLVGNAAKSTQLASLLGADYMVTGAILKYAREQRRFNAFGASTVTLLHRMKVSVQIVDLATAKLKFAKTYDLEAAQSNSQHSGVDLLEGKERELLDGLVELASDDLQKAIVAQARSTKLASTIKVPFSSSPAAADIEVNGVYVGSTPMEVQLEEGTQEIRVALQGRRPWEKKVKVSSGLKVHVTLVEAVSESRLSVLDPVRK